MSRNALRSFLQYNCNQTLSSISKTWVFVFILETPEVVLEIFLMAFWLLFDPFNSLSFSSSRCLTFGTHPIFTRAGNKLITGKNTSWEQINKR
jgi:hypothetical protein